MYFLLKIVKIQLKLKETLPLNFCDIEKILVRNNVGCTYYRNNRTSRPMLVFFYTFNFQFLPSKVFRGNAGSVTTAVVFGEKSPLVLEGCTTTQMCLYYTTPVLQFG